MNIWIRFFQESEIFKWSFSKIADKRTKIFCVFFYKNLTGWQIFFQNQKDACKIFFEVRDILTHIFFQNSEKYKWDFPRVRDTWTGNFEKSETGDCDFSKVRDTSNKFPGIFQVIDNWKGFFQSHNLENWIFSKS